MRDVCAAKVVTQRSPRGERLRVSLGEETRLRHEPHAGSKPGCERARMRAHRVVVVCSGVGWPNLPAIDVRGLLRGLLE